MKSKTLHEMNTYVAAIESKTDRPIMVLAGNWEDNGERMLYPAELKLEAIELIKKIESQIKRDDIEDFNYIDLSKELPFCDKVDSLNIKDWRGHLRSIIVYLKWFNSVSEEDLK